MKPLVFSQNLSANFVVSNKAYYGDQLENKACSNHCNDQNTSHDSQFVAGRLQHSYIRFSKLISRIDAETPVATASPFAAIVVLTLSRLLRYKSL